MLNAEQMAAIKTFIFKNGRLLERQLYEHFFAGGMREACLKSLLAYQNFASGVGNGIEPDLLVPNSTPIGGETALFIFDLMGNPFHQIPRGLSLWASERQLPDGTLPHPPENLANYPFQPWWAGPDRDRVLVIAALLTKMGIDSPEFYDKTYAYYQTCEIPGPDNFYSYPFFAYLKYCARTDEDRAQFDQMVAQLPVVLETHRSHFPLFSRYWYYAAEHVEKAVLDREAQYWVESLQADGGLPTPYPDLPWWRPIWTLDGLILFKRWGYIA